MFFKPKYISKSEGSELHIGKETKILNSEYKFHDYVNKSLENKAKNDKILKSVEFISEIPCTIVKRIEENCKYVNNEEEFVLLIENGEAKIYGKKESALLFGFTTLQHLNITNELSDMFLYDYPICSVRGYRAFLPGRENIEVFKKVVDMLVYYRYNCIVLEVGGAMEYKKHPEINESWIKFCKEVHSKPGRADEIQHHTYPWEKNSIHCDNGDGSFLTQDECRELVKYCNDRCLEVVPECPSMSHCDYLCISHHEIAERQNDAYADTYCPNNPLTYPLVFDVLSEVIDVFKPRHMHIGHDEMYSLCVCEKCKDKNPVELYVNDIKKIHDFLKERNVGTWMWGEKLLDARYPDGRHIGGAESDHYYENGGHHHVHALYPCRDMLPDDITFLHWYWVFDCNYDKVYHERNYKMVFGNLSALGFSHWKTRIGWGAKGGFCSNWGSFFDEYMQRNNQYIDLIGNACAFWTPDFDDDTKEKYLYACMKEAFSLKLANVKNPIFVEHTTNGKMKYVSFYDGVFIEDEKYEIGKYELTYSDGTKAYLPVKYGTNISCSHNEKYLNSSDFKEISYSTMPKKYGNEFYYLTVYENPYPEKNIAGFRYVQTKGKENFEVRIKKAEFEAIAEESKNNFKESEFNFTLE